jgi:hypothetical protein
MGAALASCTDCSTSTDCSTCATQSSSLYLPRPQYLYDYAQGIFSDPYYYNAETGAVDQCWNFLLGYRYIQTRKPSRIAECLLGSDKVAFVGSTLDPQPTLDTGVQYVNADNFGLATDTYKIVTLAPKIQNHIIDFSARWELGGYWDCLESLYAGVEASLVNSRWNLNACEAAGTYTAGTFNTSTSMEQCYFGDVDTVKPFTSVEAALAGDALGNSDLTTPWKYGQFQFDTARTDTKLANVTGILGYDFLRCDTYHLGLFLRTVAPTGTRPLSTDKSTGFFAPIIGNGHHWEFGGGLDSHWQLWNCDEQSIVAYLNGNVTHLFKDKQYRSFDLTTDDVASVAYGRLSRYQLLKGISSDNAYTGTLMPGINYTTREVESSFGAQGDGSISLVYYNCGWAAGLGYNFYGRSKEKIECSCGCPIEGTWAVSGDTGVCYFDAQSATQGLNATQTETQARVDKPTFPAVDNRSAIANATDWRGDAAYASDEPVVLSDDTSNLNLTGVPAQMSHTVFGHVDYQWEDCDLKPWLGVGGSAEFAQDGSCKVCTANTWSFWVRGGLSF